MSGNARVGQWMAVLQACGAVNRSIEQELARRHQICVSAYEVLAALAPARDWTRLVELSSLVSCSQPQVSRLVTQMVSRGVLERTTAPGDGRGTRVRLTEAGHQMVADATATIDGLLRDAPPPFAALASAMAVPA